MKYLCKNKQAGQAKELKDRVTHVYETIIYGWHSLKNLLRKAQLFGGWCLGCWLTNWGKKRLNRSLVTSNRNSRWGRCEFRNYTALTSPCGSVFPTQGREGLTQLQSPGSTPSPLCFPLPTSARYLWHYLLSVPPAQGCRYLEVTFPSFQEPAPQNPFTVKSRTLIFRMLKNRISTLYIKFINDPVHCQLTQLLTEDKFQYPINTENGRPPHPSYKIACLGARNIVQGHCTCLAFEGSWV